MLKLEKAEIVELLEQLKLPINPDSSLEQYFTPPETSCEFLSYFDYDETVVIDLASGPGILGICTLLRGARKVYFVDIDTTAIELVKENYDFLKEKFPEIGEAEFYSRDIAIIKKSIFSDVDIVVMNPPFGTTEKNKKIDTVFLKKAMKLADKIITMHKTVSKNFLLELIKEKNFKVLQEKDFLFPIYKTYSHHAEDKVNIEVTSFVLEKNMLR